MFTTKKIIKKKTLITSSSVFRTSEPIKIKIYRAILSCTAIVINRGLILWPLISYNYFYHWNYN